MVRLIIALLLVMAVLVVVPPTAEAGVVLTVDSVLDTPDAAINGSCNDGAGNCTLRAAIQESNGNLGLQPIRFEIGSGQQTISPLTPLPMITDEVTIDGTTQDGYSGTPLIELDGTLATGIATGLYVTAGGSTITALAINGWGTAGSTGIGIRLSGGGGNVVQGNYIGVNLAGDTAKPNTLRGIMIDDSSGNTIGGAVALRRNVISGNGERGIMIIGPEATGNRIIGNYIGTDAGGSEAIGNGDAGVHIQNSPDNIVGGDEPGEGNVISANESSGLELTANADRTVVQGNLIGVDKTGTQPLGNFTPGATLAVPSGGPISPASGIAVTGNASQGPDHVLIGGITEGARNVISANQGRGVFIGNENASDNQVLGNLIGTAVNGTTPLGNGLHGVSIANQSKLTQVGEAGAGNVIAFNGGSGVHVEGAGTDANTITANSIHDNGGKGIETLGGGNMDVAPPVITGFGSVIGTACPFCTVDVYSDDGNEGRIYEGTATADVAGDWTFVGTPEGPNVTAAATSSGSTSEFSEPVPTAGPVFIQGDVDCSGEVDALDALALVLDESGLGYDAEPECPPIGSGDPEFGDVNCSGTANGADAALPLMFRAGVDIVPVNNCVPVGDPLTG